MELKKFCIVRCNKDIRDTLLKRIVEESMTLTDVAELAKKKGRSFDSSQLSRFFKETKVPDKRIPTQEDILWLCNYFGIDVKLDVTVKNKKIK